MIAIDKEKNPEMFAWAVRFNQANKLVSYSFAKIPALIKLSAYSFLLMPWL
jgi:hypothetical protein